MNVGMDYGSFPAIVTGYYHVTRRYIMLPACDQTGEEANDHG